LIIYNLFEVYIWKWNLLNPMLVKKPNINGTWKIVGISDWVNPSTNKINPPNEIYIAIKQNYSSIKIRIYTKNSESEQLISTIEKTSDDRFKLLSIYQNIPQKLFRNKSNIHYATFMLFINGSAEKVLKGSYWTDRSTSGEIYTLGYSSKYFHSFKEAENNLSLFEERNNVDSISI